MPTTREITKLLVAWSEGDREALDQLVPLVQSELRRLARGYMSRERQGHILQTTALIHEAYMRLIDWQDVSWQNRAHFFGVAARMMRRILVNYAIEQKSLKRGGGAPHVTLEEAAKVFSECNPDLSGRNPDLSGRNPDLIDLDAALDKLAAMSLRQSQVIELRFFGELSLKEIAEVVGVSIGTVKRDLILAKLWLLGELGGRQDNDS